MTVTALARCRASEKKVETALGLLAAFEFSRFYTRTEITRDHKTFAFLQ